MKQSQANESTFIHPGTHLLHRQFMGQSVVTLDQTRGLVRINLNGMTARSKPAEVVDVINRALTDFNLPGAIYYSRGTYRVNWIKVWNWKEFIKGERELYLHEDCGEDPAAVALGIKEPNNDYEDEPVPLVLTREDWTEIYYALESKLIHLAEYNQVKTERIRWEKHLKRIIDKIGPDGDIAAASGVEVNG